MIYETDIEKVSKELMPDITDMLYTIKILWKWNRELQGRINRLESGLEDKYEPKE